MKARYALAGALALLILAGALLVAALGPGEILRRLAELLAPEPAPVVLPGATVPAEVIPW